MEVSIKEKINEELKNFVAKSYPEQSLYTHTKEVLDKLEELLKKYGSHFSEEQRELFYLACLYHDYGKINDLFQKKIKLGISHIEGEIPHGFFSPYFLDKEEIMQKYGEDIYKILCTALFYHHTRKNEGKDEAYHHYFENYVKPVSKEFLHKDLSYLTFQRKKLLFQFPNITPKSIKQDDYLLFSLVKGILNRCDYAASAGAEKIEDSLEDDGKYLTDHILDVYAKKLKEAQRYMTSNKDKNLVVVAPTGSGKTEGSLLWLGQEKGFYTLPLKVASTAIYDRIFKDYHYHKVTLLHSDALSVLLKDKSFEEGYRKYKDTKLFAYPLTICTVDQLFKFPFKALGTEKMLATLSYSKVIIDEIQMYSSTILACLIMGLSMVTKLGGKFLIMTATIPKFFLLLLDQYVGENSYLYKECLQDTIPYRHCFTCIDGDFCYENIIEKSQNKKILVICNTVKKAKQVYKDLMGIDGSCVLGLLHSQFIKKDRTQLEYNILHEEKCGIWVTTQIVEVSLDIDFDELHTEMVTADSLLQRFGRCYRKREYKQNEPNIFIYNTRNGVPYIYDRDIYDRSYTFLEKYENQKITEQDKLDYMNFVYDEEEIKNTKYYTSILESIDFIQKIYPSEYENEEVNQKFRDIFSIQIIPDCVFEKPENGIEELIQVMNSKVPYAERIQAQYALMEYTLPISKYAVKSKTNIKGTDIFRAEGKYDSKTGFEAKEDTFYGS